MAAITASFVAAPLAAPATAAPLRKDFAGSAMPVLPSRARVSMNFKKSTTKTPYGINGSATFKVDAQGNPAKGKGVYQFTKKYGANVDGYSPIYTPNEWSATGDTFAGGPKVLALWFATFVGLLAVSVGLIYTTSSL